MLWAKHFLRWPAPADSVAPRQHSAPGTAATEVAGRGDAPGRWVKTLTRRYRRIALTSQRRGHGEGIARPPRPDDGRWANRLLRTLAPAERARERDDGSDCEVVDHGHVGTLGEDGRWRQPPIAWLGNETEAGESRNCRGFVEAHGHGGGSGRKASTWRAPADSEASRTSTAPGMQRCPGCRRGEWEELWPSSLLRNMVQCPLGRVAAASAAAAPGPERDCRGSLGGFGHVGSAACQSCSGAGAQLAGAARRRQQRPGHCRMTRRLGGCRGRRAEHPSPKRRTV